MGRLLSAGVATLLSLREPLEPLLCSQQVLQACLPALALGEWVLPSPVALEVQVAVQLVRSQTDTIHTIRRLLE